jgi:hypothetical protein
MLRLWQDDSGALISMEFLFVATILVLGVVIGLVAVRDVVATQLSELANAIGSLNMCFSFAGLTACDASVCGSQAVRMHCNTVGAIGIVNPTTVCPIDVNLPCLP